MKVIVAEGPLLDQITSLTYDIWHEGLSERAYSQWNAAQMRTPWGRTHLQRLALVDVSGRLLATAKRYRYRMRLDGRVGWMSGIGAVFTPPLQRGKGYASQLIEQLLEIERKDGALLAGLFSEIGATFYERLGFTVVPIDEVRYESSAAMVRQQCSSAPVTIATCPRSNRCIRFDRQASDSRSLATSR